MPIDDHRFKRLFVRLVGWGVGRLGLSRQTAEDCAQESLLILYKKYPEVEHEKDAIPLSLTILRKVAAAYRRRASTVHESGGEALEDLQAAGDPGNRAEELHRRRIQEAFYEILNSLKENCRDLLLWQIEGLSGDEIAQRAKLPSRNAVFIRITRCKGQLRKQFEDLLGEPASLFWGRE